MLPTETKLFFIKATKFILIIIVVDFILGLFANHIFQSQKTGQYARINHIAQDTSAKVIITGSSHAIKHYVPEVLDSVLGIETYNAGANGQKLIYAYAIQKIILKKRAPELIVLNIDEDWLYTSDIAYKRFSVLYPFYKEHKDVLKPILDQESKFSNYKLLLNSYRNNSTIVHIIKYFLIPQKDYKGYMPLYSTMDKSINSSELQLRGEYTSEEIDPNFVLVLENLISSAKDNNVRLLFVISPKFSKANLTKNASYQKILEIVNEQKITLYDFQNDSIFTGEHELFYDATHLNDKGARLFSRRLAEKIAHLKDN
tara:strand:+ start:45543 stop:46484 length:942 start_codon:yes stop_codon:yes gene_type:complete